MDMNIEEYNFICNVIASSYLPIFVFQENKIVSVNDVALKFLNYSDKEEIILQPIDKIIKDYSFHFQYRERLELSINTLQFIAWNQSIITKKLYILKNKDYIYLFLVDSPEPKPIFDFLKDVIDTTDQVILFFNPETGEVLIGNEKASELYGYSFEQLTKKKIQELNGDAHLVFKQIDHTKTIKCSDIFFQQYLMDGGIKNIEFSNFSSHIKGQTILLPLIIDKIGLGVEDMIHSSLFDDLDFAIVKINKDTTVHFFNKKFMEIFEYTTEEAIGCRLNDLIIPEEYYQDLNETNHQLFEGNILQTEVFRKTKSGKILSMECITYPILKNRIVVGANIIYRDITNKNKLVNELSLMRKALENNNDGVIISDKDRKILWVNNAFLSITEYTQEEIIDQDCKSILFNYLNEENYHRINQELIMNGRWSNEIVNRKKSGEEFYQWISVSTINNTNQEIINYVTLIRDVSLYKENKEKVAYLSKYDTLTGFFNRNFFFQILHKLSANAGKNDVIFALLSIQLVTYNEVNNTFGKEESEKYLMEFSSYLKNYKVKKRIIARTGIDEFMLLINQFESREQLEEISQYITQFASQKYSFNSRVFVGISIYPDHGKEDLKLIQYANIAMNNSKLNLNTKYHIFQEKMKSMNDEVFEIISRFNFAVLNQEFYMVYQPIVGIKSDEIVGFEALIRWKTQDGKLIPPDRFIPILESTGDIYNLGKWIIEKVSKQVCEWRNLGLRVLPISVNLSLKQIENMAFIDDLDEILQKYQIQESEIAFEVTETIYSGNWAVLSRNIRYLNDKNFRISLDDFGTGYSSLSQIQKINVHALKIDKSFIRDSLIPKTIILIDAIIKMAHALGMKVIGEGVETAEELNLMKKMNCDEVQGFYFSKPLAVENIHLLLRTNGSLSIKNPIN